MQRLTDLVRHHRLQALLVAISLAIMIYGIVGTYRHLTASFQRQKILDGRSSDRAEDLRIIRDPAKSDWDKAHALVRLAISDPDTAVQLAREWIKLDNPVLVKAGIQALMYSREKLDERSLFELYVKSKDPKYRPFQDDLVDSLVGKPLALESLYEMAALPWTKDLARTRIFGAIARNETDSQKKTEALEFLKKEAATGEGDVHAQAILSLSAIEPKDEDVVKLNREVIERGELDLEPYSIAHLARIGDPWIAQKWKSLVVSKDDSVRSAALRVIPIICPAEVVPELEKIYFSTEDKSLRQSIIGLASQLDRAPASEFLKKAIADKTLSDPDRKALESMLLKATATAKICKI